MKNQSFTRNRPLARLSACFFLAGLLSFFNPAGAQTDTAHANPPAAAAAAPVVAAQPQASASPTILAVKNLNNPKSRALGLGDFIQVKVSSPAAFYTPQDSVIILYLNDIPMNGIRPLAAYAADSTFTFQLSRDSIDRAAWNAFYQYPRRNQNNVRVALGNRHGVTTPSYPSRHTLIITPKYSVAVSLVFTGLLLALFIALARKSSLLKDMSLQAHHHHKPYSFARTQLAFWTFIIISSYFFIYLTSGELTPVTGSTLILLSISTATAATASFIDTDQHRNKRLRHQNNPSNAFLTDIVSDAQGVSIHRLQVLLWTLVLGFAFIRSVIKDLSMPQFGEGLLLLMGISTTAYLGLKTQENSAGAPQNPSGSQTEGNTTPGTTPGSNPNPTSGAGTADNAAPATAVTGTTPAVPPASGAPAV